MIEIKKLFEKSYLVHKEGWEQARLITFMIANSVSRKKLSLQDIMKFPWEDETEKDTSISNEDIERLTKQAEQIAKELNG